MIRSVHLFHFALRFFFFLKGEKFVPLINRESLKLISENIKKGTITGTFVSYWDIEFHSGITQTATLHKERS